jgi:MFS family permease
MALYARIAARVADGEGYHEAALAEHRASGYPTRPLVTVRLPTLAWAQALLGIDGVRWAALAVVSAAIAALLRNAPLLASIEERIIAAALLAAGGGAALSPVAGYDHDFIAGVLLSLALIAYRPGRWWPALIAAAVALAVRELAAPFVALWLAFALHQRRRGEALALTALLAVFALAMGLHAQAVEAARLPGDPVSQGWGAMAGYGVPLAGLVQLTGLRHLPALLAAPLAVLPLIGWAGLGGRLGLFALLWFTGLATGMALFARPANYYWIELALPAYAIGLAFAPRALAELFARLTVQSSKQI